MQTLLQLGVTVIALGLDPLAAAITGYFVAFNSFFQHWNVRTPQRRGYLIQRPEAHRVHHRMGVHYYNYADLTVRKPANRAIIDVFFGGNHHERAKRSRHPERSPHGDR